MKGRAYLRIAGPAARGRWPALLLIALAVLVTAALGTVASVRAGEFYSQLQRPAWAPPGSLFGPVWSVLYLTLIAAGWLAWRARAVPGSRRVPFAFFGGQLALNALWSWLFFRWHLGGLALAEVLLLWVAIAVTMVHFWRLRPVAGALLLPYLLWVGFASALNLAVWRLNPTLL